jgi:hypothetical protein
VRRLAADLPAFDSVWLDALVQLGRLTPFQVRILESANPHLIAAGPCVLVDQLGHGIHNRTLPGRHRGSNRTLALKLVPSVAARPLPAANPWKRLVDGLNRLDSTAVVGPQICQLITQSGGLDGDPFQRLREIVGD